MNALEAKMLDALKKGKDEYGVVAIKAEFEAEGTRTDELLRLLEVVRRADLKIGLKIGGCEAVRDLHECKQFGVDYIIAPMIETPYALSKYIAAKNSVYFSEYERSQVKFLFNVETIGAFNNLEGLVKEAKTDNGADGMVFGRVDFTGSMGLSRADIASDKVTKYCTDVAQACKDNQLEMVVGGGVAFDSLQSIRDINRVHLNRFETRKVIFEAGAVEAPYMEDALLNAGYFELLWLQNKRDYYQAIGQEDKARIEMLQARFEQVSCAA